MSLPQTILFSNPTVMKDSDEFRQYITIQAVHNNPTRPIYINTMKKSEVSYIYMGSFKKVRWSNRSILFAFSLTPPPHRPCKQTYYLFKFE